MRICCKKDGYHGRQAYIRDVIMTTMPWEHIFGMGGLDI